MRIFVDIKDFEKVQKAMNELVANVGKPFEQVLEGGGQEIRKEAVRSIQQDPKSGIIYQRYNPRRRHQASAKGEKLKKTPWGRYNETDSRRRKYEIE